MRPLRFLLAAGRTQLIITDSGQGTLGPGYCAW